MGKGERKRELSSEREGKEGDYSEQVSGLSCGHACLNSSWAQKTLIKDKAAHAMLGEKLCICVSRECLR